MRILTPVVCFFLGVTSAAAGEFAVGAVVNRSGGLLPCENVPGEARVRIDPHSFTVTTLSKVGKTGFLAFAGNDIYLSGAPCFRRVANVLGAGDKARD